MKMRNLPKSQQPDLRAENSREQPMGLQQHIDKIPHPDGGFSWP